jgi:serine/threonine protein kinase
VRVCERVGPGRCSASSAGVAEGGPVVGNGCGILERVTEALVGETVDTRYELRRLIAHGGMGLVFEAAHRFTRRVVALKLLPDTLRSQKEARGRLLREAHALTAVRHPGFVEVLDAGVCAGHGPYVVLEMLEGRTLDGILASRRRLSIADTVQIGRQVCDALAHAHARGVIHRDLKPSNVFVSRNEVGDEMVKLIDLGVAAVAEEQLQDRDRKLTTAHEVLGTPEYMAPEQLWGRPIDARTDVYAVGMSLYECLTGEVPYVGNYPDVLVQVSNAANPPNVRERRGDVPPALAVVIENALEKDAAARFQSIIELGRALVAASGLTPGHTSLLAPTDDDDPDSEREEHTEPEIKLVKKKSRARAVSGNEDRPSSPQSGPTQKRHFVRAPYVTPVVLVAADGATIDARSEEISQEGMLVLSPVHLEVGIPLAVRFATPITGEMIEIHAGIRWTRDGRGKTAMGLEFTRVPPILRRVVEDYIASLASSVA